MRTRIFKKRIAQLLLIMLLCSTLQVSSPLAAHVTTQYQQLLSNTTLTGNPLTTLGGNFSVVP